MKDNEKFKILVILLLLWAPVMKPDEICDAIVIDAITTLQNGTIVIFRKNQIWFLHRGVEISGPCPVNSVFEELKGPVDAAITLLSHDSITEFVGSSIYFDNGNYYTYKNLGKYNVEWGALVYLPHKGIQAKMGATVPEAAKLMAGKISAAYFDPIDGKSKFIFSNGSVLAFTFESGADYDTPLISTLATEFKKYGIEGIPATITAALTLTTDKVNEIYLFDGLRYCSFKLNPELSDQKCEWKMARESFLNCDKVVRKNGNCGKMMVEPQPEKIAEPIALPEQPIDSVTKGAVSSSSGIVGRYAAPQAGRRNGDTNGDSGKKAQTSARSSGYSLLYDSILCKLILNFFFILYIQIFD